MKVDRFRDAGCNVALHADDDGTPVAVVVVAEDGSGDGYVTVSRQPDGQVVTASGGALGDDATCRLCAFMAAVVWKDRPIPRVQETRRG